MTPAPVTNEDIIRSIEMADKQLAEKARQADEARLKAFALEVGQAVADAVLTRPNVIEVKVNSLEGAPGPKPGQEEITALLSDVVSKTLTDERLISLLRPMIPAAVAGETPSDDRLLGLIQAVMPAPKHGETPSDTKLRALIRPMIPSVKNGETPTKTALLALMKPLVPTIESLVASKALKNMLIDLIRKIMPEFVKEQKPYSVSFPLGGGSSSSSSAALSVLTVTGTVNDANLSFTCASRPTLVVVNGSIYRTTGDLITWTYAGTTLTLSQAVGTGGSIYALG